MKGCCFCLQKSDPAVCVLKCQPEKNNNIILSCCHVEVRFYESNVSFVLGVIIIPYLRFTPGFSTIILSSIEDSGPGGYSLQHLRGRTLCGCSRHGVLPHHTLWKAPEVNPPHKRNHLFPSHYLPLLLHVFTLGSLIEQILATHWWCHQDGCVREEG